MSALQLPNTPLVGSERVNPAIGLHERVDLPGAFRVELFPPAEPFKIGIVLTATGSAHSRDGDAALFFVNISRSVTWGGLEGVYDFFTGERLEDWTLTSASGFDYTQPFSVPEPSTFALAALGILGLTVVARRRRVSLRS